MLILLLVPISFLIFHDKGNEYLKPYVGTYLQSKLEHNMSVELQHLKIDLGYLELTTVLNDLTKVKVEGEISLFAQTLDMDYTLKSDGFKTFDNKVDIEGTVVGNFNNLYIKGQGETLKSHITYALNVKDELINNIKVHINKADIASLLELTAQPAYAKGKVDINISIPTITDMNTKGTAKIVLHSSTLNEKVFKKELKIDLPKKTTITANINSKISTESFELEGDIKSNLASIRFSKTTYSLKSKELLTNYALTVPKLSNLIFLTKQKFNGKLVVDGKLIVKKGAFNVQGNTKSLNGITAFNFNGQKLYIDMKNVEIAKLLHFLGEKPYATGKLTSEVKLSDLNNLRGTFKVKTQEAKTINQTLKKELNIDFEKAIAFSLNSEGDIASEIISIQSTLNSDIFNYRSNDIKYKLDKAILSSTYLLEIPELTKLNAIVNKTLKGNLTITGKINYNKTLEVTGLTKSLDGNINFKLLNKKVNATIDHVAVEKLMHMLDYPQIFKAQLIGDFKYNLVTRQGIFTSKLNKARLLSNELTVLIKEIRGVDLTKERYNKTQFNAILDKDTIDINFIAKSKKVLLEIPAGRINKNTNIIDAKYSINIENTDIAGKIKGNISKPNISINSSDFLKDKVIDVIKNNIPEETLKDFGLDKIKLENIKTDEIEDTVKNFIGDLFR
jgi:hypothetical protein